ncbi:MAG: PAS domain-containing protein [Myxococcales bacterium]|nr:PAS domain-containing protein [Myxococcales bacterium]MCB9646710.1 PAS domain-containing protein [Deltaproteobacteria bacterium]
MERARSPETLLTRIAAHIPGVIYQYRLDPDGRSSFPFASDGIRSIYEVTPEEVREDAAAVMARLHPEDRPGVWDSILRSAETLEPWRHEYRVLLPERGERWLLGEASPERLADGAVLWHGYISDVTDRKRVERELRAQEERFRGLFVAIGQGLLIYDERGVVVERNPAAERLFGLPMAESELGEAWRIITPDGAPVAEEDEPAQVVLRTGQAVRGRLFGLFRPGAAAPRWYEVDAHPRFRPGELRPYQVVALVTDVTEQRAAQAELTASEDRLRRVLLATDEGVWDWQVREDRVVHNPRWYEILGLEPGQEDLQTFLDRVHPDDVEALQERISVALERDEPYFSEHRMLRADGQEIWVHDRGRVVERDASERPTRMLGSMSDITPRKRAERERAEALATLDRFFTLSLDLLCILDAERRFVRLNAAWAATLGHETGELVGQPLESFVHPDDLAATQAVLDRLSGGDVARSFETRYRAADGTWRWIEWRARSHGGQIYAAARDVSEARAREVALQEARAAAEEASRAKSAFLATMSHEIRTPMNGVVGAAELLMDSALGSDQASLVRTITGSADALLNIINDILDFSRVESGKLAIEQVPVAVADVVRDTVDALMPRCPPQVRLHIEIDEATPGHHLGDPYRLRQVLTNLVGNALKFTPEGMVAVRVEGDAHGLAMLVQDTGIGIEPHRLEALFEPFVQGDSSTVRRFGGTGLGLAITKGLVERMGGTISASSSPGAGTTFAVQLPWPATEPAKPAPLPTAPTRVGRGAKVLVAEDNLVNQEIVRRMLEGLGAEVTLVDNGYAAVEQAALHPWGLVLMDVQMPGMDGFEATRQIRAQERAHGQPRVPIVALTANAMEGDRERCLAAGMDDYLAKPLRRQALAECLGALGPEAVKAAG